MTVRGRMATDRAARYAKQLAGHWGAKGTATELEGGAYRIETDRGGVTTLTPAEDALLIEASSPEFADVVARHLERFGQRDEVQVVWDDAD